MVLISEQLESFMHMEASAVHHNSGRMNDGGAAKSAGSEARKTHPVWVAMGSKQ